MNILVGMTKQQLEEAARQTRRITEVIRSHRPLPGQMELPFGDDEAEKARVATENAATAKEGRC